ncbi:MAG: tetratricopeptide repeat protein [Candidatus Krumholzibacteriota bacterium]|nr:tetratricopeptide repeat protein [Candidatus Krumholzibacteriota bacterium]
MNRKSTDTREGWPLRFVLGGVVIVVIAILAAYGLQTGVQKQEGESAEVERSLADWARAEASLDDETRAGAYAAAAESDVTPVEPAAAPAETETSTEDEASPAAPPADVDYFTAEDAYLAGDYDQAAHLFTAFAYHHPEHVWGNYMLGLSEWKRGDAAAAEAALRAALAIRPEHRKSLLNLGRVLMELGRNEEALELVDRVREAAPGDAEADRLRGRALHNLGRADEAAAAYHQALSLDPEDAWSLNNLGLILIEQERFDDALVPLARAAELAPAIACAQNNLGVALERAGYLAMARAAYERAVAADSEHASALASAARLADRVDDPELPALDLAILAGSFAPAAEEDLAGTPAGECEETSAAAEPVLEPDGNVVMAEAGEIAQPELE